MHRSQWTIGVLALLAVSASTSGATTATPMGGPYRNGLIAFVRCCGRPDTGIYLIRPNGTGERRVFTSPADDAPLDPAWSPDGRQIAYVPGGHDGGVWVMRKDGTTRRRVTSGKGDSLFPSWSPDGRWIIFSDLARRSGFHDLYRVRTDGTGLRRLTRSAADELMSAWAPNGGVIVYARGRDLWRMRVDGSRQRWLVRDATAPSWSPGGTHVAFIRHGDPWIVARDGDGARLVLHMSRPQASLAWSPDGRLLVTAPFDRGNLMLLPADGSQTSQLTREPGYANSWPSWQRLAR
jgi:TolB protein